jgi:anaerobic selenocysteine-containing dehydrogenase
VEAELIIKAARLYATTKPASLLTGASPTVHHTNGVQNHRAITLLVGLTGNFDREGGNYILTPNYLYVPNGLSFRETEFSQSRPYSEMAPRIGADIYPIWCKFVSEAQSMHIPFQIRTKHPYPIKAIVAFGLNYRMWPGSDFMEEALKMLEFFVDVDIFMTDSAKLADLILPASTSFERSELKTYPESFVIWTTPVIKPIGESRSDVDIITELAKRIAPEDSLLTKGYEECANWIMEPSGLTVEELKRHPSGFFPESIKMPPYKKYEKTGFPTPSGKMEFTSTVLKEAGFDPLPEYKEPKLSPISSPEIYKDFPLVLTTGSRLPNFIHSQTFRLAWTKGLSPDPLIDINPSDAEKRGINSGDWVILSTPRGSTSVKANVSEKVPLGVVNIYHGYPEVDINKLIEPDYLDPISGFPGFKSLLCEVKK